MHRSAGGYSRRPAANGGARSEGALPKEALERFESRVGFDVRALQPQEAAKVGLPNGAIVIASMSRGGEAARAGLRPGDWLRAVASRPIAGESAFAKAVAESYWRGILLLVQRGRRYQQFAVRF